MKKLLYILFSSLVFSVGCSRKVALQKSVTQDKTVEVHKTIDTSMTITQTSSKDYYDFGDTLQAVLNTLADSTISTENFESSGIKIIATTTRLNNGIVQTHFTAIAKPKQIVNETQTTSTEHKGIATVDSVKKDVVASVTNKVVESSGMNFKTWGLLFLFIAIAALILYIIGQWKKWW